MKNRSSTPVEALNACVFPTSIVSTPGAPGSTSDDVAKGSVIDGGFGTRTSSSGSVHENGSPKSFTWPASKNVTMRTWLMIEIRYSALNSRLLLPPRTTNDPGTLGPIDRMSNPRTLYSPPRNNRSKTGNTASQGGVEQIAALALWPTGEMYSIFPRNPIDVLDRWRKKKIASPLGL